MDEDCMFSRVDADGKKSELITVRFGESRRQFIDARRKQEGMESPSEYLRHLVELDYNKAATEFRLLADALGVKVSNENIEI